MSTTTAPTDCPAHLQGRAVVSVLRSNATRFLCPVLCVLTLCVLPTAMATDPAAPVISRVHGAATKTIWGANLEEPTSFLAAATPIEQEAIENAIRAQSYDAARFLPKVPPAEAKALKVVDRDELGRVAAVIATEGLTGIGNADASTGPEILWARTDTATSSPVLLRSAQPWWIYPLKSSPGDRIRVFGRNLRPADSRKMSVLLAIKSADGAEISIISPLRAGRNAMYEQEFELPSDLKPGKFLLYVHNGSGGEAGWGGPLEYEIVTADSKKSPSIAVSLPPVGEDATESIQKALNEAEKSSATVVLGPGIFEISKTLRVPPGVSLRGSGRGATTIRPVPSGMTEDFPLEEGGVKFEGYSRDWIPHMRGKGYAPLLWLRDRSSLSDLRLEQDRTSGIGVLVARAPGIARDIRISRISCISHDSTLGWVPTAAVRSGGNTEMLSIVECELEGRGAIEITSESNRGLYIARNTVRGVPEGEYNVMFIRGSRESVIEDNRVSGGKRAIVFQDARVFGKDEVPEGTRNSGGTLIHTMVAGNVLTDTAPRRHNDGETMFESNDHFWAGKPTDVTANGFSVSDAPFNAKLVGNFAFVIDGPGLGEYREIVSHTKDTLTLDRPWTVPPTEESVIKVAAFATRCLWVDNSEFHIAGPLMLWGSCVENVVDGHIQREGNGFVLWAPKTEYPMTVAFNDVINSRFVRGGNMRFIGPFVFGNSVRFCEVIDFAYRPNYHSVQGWVANASKETDETKPGWPRTDVGLQVIPLAFNSKLKMPYLSPDAPISAWNIIEGNHFRGSGDGISIPEQSRHFLLRGNAIRVSGKALDIAPGSATVIP